MISELTQTEIFDTVFNQKINPIQGWSSKDELKCLFELSSRCKSKSLEIGAFCGRTTAAIGLGRELNPIESSKIHVVVDHFICTNPDAPDNIEKTFRTNIQNLHLIDITVNLFPISSRQAFPELEHDSFGLIFIDGNHEYKSVLEDLSLYAPLVEQGGILVLHDYHGKFGKDVAGAVADYFTACPDSFTPTDSAHSIQIFKRNKNA